MGAKVPGGEAIGYAPGIVLTLTGRARNVEGVVYTPLKIIGKIKKNKNPPIVIDYVDTLSTVTGRFSSSRPNMANTPRAGSVKMSRRERENFQKRMGYQERWSSEIKVETKNNQENALKGFTNWERRIKLIIDSHEK